MKKLKSVVKKLVFLSVFCLFSQTLFSQWVDGTDVLSTNDKLELNNPSGIFTQMVRNYGAWANSKVTTWIGGTYGVYGVTSYYLNNYTGGYFLKISNGNFGIGTSNPSKKLDVVGDINFTGDLYKDGTLLNLGRSWTTSGTNLYYTSGNVGIGIDNPVCLLQVSDVNITLGSGVNHYQLLTRFSAKGGASGNNVFHNEYRVRDASGTDWTTHRIHDAISVDASYGTPRANTKTWWERDPYDDIQSWGNEDEAYLTIYQGNVGIGTTAPDAKLAVNGLIKATEIKVTATVPASDHVFNDDYDLKTLNEVENFVKENKHLPEVPSAAEFKENGYSVGQMDDLLLRKIEELTLYIIEQQKEIEALKNIISE